jgi:tetratricopeptide (TPR) repeat protein
MSSWRERHAAWYAELISGGGRPWWGSRGQGEMYERLDVEWANVEAALDFLTEAAPDGQIGLRMATDLWLHWLVRGRYRAGSRRLAAFLKIEPAPTPARVMPLWALGFLSQASGDYAPALRAVEEARLVCDQTGGDRELAYALHGLALVNLRLGNLELLREFAPQAHERILRVDDPMGLAMSLYFLATVAATAAQLADARRVGEDALRASERAGDMMIRGLSHGLLGTVEWLLSETRSAEARFKEAVRIQQLIGHRWGMLTSFEGLARIAGSTGDLERAALLLGAGAALSEQLGIALFPYGQAHHDACEAAVLVGLGEDRYGTCWERGRALRHGEVVATALDAAIPAGSHPPAAADAHDASDELSAREL